MLRGYRIFIVAAGLVLASPCYGKDAKQQQSKPRADSANKLERIALAVEKLPSVSAPDRGCQPGQDKRESDLCAQWKAADAAADSAYWTFWTFFIALIGLVVGGGTLVAAWLAARWAKKAADFTETGANAAKGAVEETRRIGEAQVRAYLSIVGAEAKHWDDEFEFRVLVKNTGQSPAFILLCEYEILLPDGKRPHKVFEEPLSVGAGIQMGAPLAQFLNPLTGNKMFVAKVRIVYEDVFRAETTICETFAGPTLWNEDGIAVGFAVRHDMLSAMEAEQARRNKAKRKPKRKSTENDDNRHYGQ